MSITNYPLKFGFRYVFLATIVLVSSILLVKRFDESLILLGSISVLLLFLLFFYFVKGMELKEVILFLTLSPLLYLGIYFHYLIFFVILQDLLLLILFIYSFFTIKKTENKNTVNLEKAIWVFTIYIFLMFVYGIRSNSFYFAFEEFYHILYYFFAIPLAIIFLERKSFQRIFNYIFFLYFLISIEYIIANILLSYGRFVTFQAYFLPIIVSIVFAIILFGQNKGLKKVSFIFLFLTFILALVITKTRTVWVATLIPMAIIFVHYLIKERNWGFKGISFLSILGMGLLVVFFMTSQPAQQTEQNTNDIEYRTSSLSNPVEDQAFLMRVELGYYTYLKFLESPIFGHGMGDYVKYKFLGIVDKPVYFPDNSWFYFLWKGGIIGFILFLLIFIYAMKSALLIYKHSSDNWTKVIALGIFAGLVGMILLGLLNAILIKYKTTILFPIIFAYLIVEHKKIKENEIIFK